LADIDVPVTRYEQIMTSHSTRPADLPARFAEASRAARAATPVSSVREAAIRDVAAGVAGPALVGFVLWMLREARARRLQRLKFLSRDGQVLYELARRTARWGPAPDLEYVFSSRLTWSLAATDPDRLAATPWLFNSFMKSNAADLCARLGLVLDEYQPVLVASGVSLDPEVRAHQPGQGDALRRFVGTPEVTLAVTRRVTAVRRLVAEYAAQHALADSSTGLVDAGWTGRMIGSLVQACGAADMSRPHALLWGHEPRASGWTDPHRVAAYMYNTAIGQGRRWRVPDAPFVVETFCMSDHGIVSTYHRDESGRITPVLLSATNTPAMEWGLPLYRTALYAFCDAIDGHPHLAEDVRPVVHEVMDAFWCHPTEAEAHAWGTYPYDSDPAATAVRPLARPVAIDGGHVSRGDRAWLAGSLVLSAPATRAAYLRQLPRFDRTGAPAVD